MRWMGKPLQLHLKPNYIISNQILPTLWVGLIFCGVKSIMRALFVLFITMGLVFAAPLETIKVIWTAQPSVGSIDTFRLYGTTNLKDPMKNWKLIGKTTGTNRIIEITIPSYPYYLTMNRSNISGNSPFSNIVTVSAPYIPPAPPGPATNPKG